MKTDFELFPGKNLSDLFKDIYENQIIKKKRISELIFEIKNKIRNINDWAVIGPLIRDLVDTSVRNDEALIKLATIAQRITTSTSTSEEGAMMLSDSEKKQLLESLEEVAVSVVTTKDEEIEELAQQVDDIKNKMNDNE